MSKKQKYLRISDGCTSLTAKVEYVLEEMKTLFEWMSSGEKWTFEVVEMTQEELDALPEHSGW